jgi:hypothetical protein
MEYVDKQTGEVRKKVPMEVQVQVAENIVTVYHEHLLGMFHAHLINAEEREDLDAKAQAVLATMKWLDTNRDELVAFRKSKR